MIIDLHVHHTLGPEPRTDFAAMRRLKGLAKQVGINRVCLLGNVFRFGIRANDSQIRLINDSTLELVRADGDFLSGFCFLNPALGSGFLRGEIRRCAREGLCGIKLEIDVNARDRRLEDERGMYPAMQVAGVEVDEVVSLAASVPQLPIIALCPYLAEARQLARRTRNVCVDLAHIEAPDTVKTALSEIPADRLMFGSHTPFLCTNAEVMKLQSANVAARDLRRVAEGNARRVLSKHRLDVR